MIIYKISFDTRSVEGKYSKPRKEVWGLFLYYITSGQLLVKCRCLSSYMIREELLLCKNPLKDLKYGTSDST